MNEMLKNLKNNTNHTLTENGGVARATTNNSLMDFFAQAGAMRERSETDIISMFDGAYGTEPLLALKSLFYFRNIRGGQGERRLFRILIKWLADNKKYHVINNLTIISEFGRWDDYYSLVGTRCETEMFTHLKEQLDKDLKAETPSLLGKWLKSENASSTESKQLAKKTREAFKLPSKDYRKALSLLRKKINIVETHMSNSEWKTIDYEKVPSRASMIYRKAFYRNDEDRYQEFLDAVEKGEKTIKATTLYPYDIVNKVLYQGDNTRTIDALWKALPNYVEEQENSIAVVDVSGSMYGFPMTVSIGLGMYLAERNKGPYHNHFITFSESPKIQEITGTTIVNKIKNLSMASWGMNTNIKAVFDLILRTALDNKVSPEEMIKKIYIISDMEFDSASGSGWSRTSKYNKTVMETIKDRFRIADVYFPQLVFWNANARNKQYPATMNDAGVQLVSGSSPSLFKQLVKSEFKTAYDLMLDVLNDKAYEVVRL